MHKCEHAKTPTHAHAQILVGVHDSKGHKEKETYIQTIIIIYADIRTHAHTSTHLY